jgi:hypothetical protein
LKKDGPLMPKISGPLFYARFHEKQCRDFEKPVTKFAGYRFAVHLLRKAGKAQDKRDCYSVRVYIASSVRLQSCHLPHGFTPGAPHPPRKLGTFPSGEGSGVCGTAIYKAFPVLGGAQARDAGGIPVRGPRST